MICLAITEPSAGSDVAQLKTEAKKTSDGKYLNKYIYKKSIYFDRKYVLYRKRREKVDYQWYAEYYLLDSINSAHNIL